MTYRIRPAPVGTLGGNFVELRVAGCIHCAGPELLCSPTFNFLMVVTNGNPCNGCPQWQTIGEKCTAYQLYHTEPQTKKLTGKQRIEEATKPGTKNGENYAGMSVAQIAAELGVSKSEVRRRKLGGVL